MEESVTFAKKYLEDILSFFGLNIEIDALANEEGVIELHVPSTQLNGFLIGQRGDTMHSLQFVIGSALRNQGYEQSRVYIDVADYKKQRAERLAEKVGEWIEKVNTDKEDFHVRPMNAADRRVVHQAAADGGMTTESQGEGRDRHVVIKSSTQPASAEE